MANVSGWDTVGVTKLGAMSDNRINLQFTGKDGAARNVFVPAASVGNLVTHLMALCAKIEQTHDVGEVMEQSQNLTAHSVAFGAARDGSEFSLVVTTPDNLQLRFLLTPETTEALAGGLIATLSEHGRSPTQTKSEGPKH